MPVEYSVLLEEPVIRLAEILAASYGVTVQELIEGLLLYCSELSQDAGAAWGLSLAPDPSDTRPTPVERRWRRGPGNLIVLRNGRDVAAVKRPFNAGWAGSP
jgi:hypothetical protein